MGGAARFAGQMMDAGRRRLRPVLVGLVTIAVTLTGAVAGVGGSPTSEQFRWMLVAAVTAGLGAYITTGGEKLAPSSVKRAALAPFRNETRARSRLLERVRSFWIDSVLDQSLEHLARIELSLEDRPDAVERDSDWIRATPKSHDQSIPVGTPMADIFEQADKSLLIMGAPGAGKTTMMLELAHELLGRAESDPTHPIPVVFNLASWDKDDHSMSSWLVAELRERYRVHPGFQWIEGEEVLPLLDGLDEVPHDHRPQCVTAINAFRDEHGLLPLVVCTRLQDYEELGERLRLQRAVAIQPLSRDQVRNYLEASGPGPASMLDALHVDDAMWELLESPLLLSVVTLAYREDASAPASEPTDTLEERRNRLFSVFTETMLARRGRSTSRYPPQQTVRWLAWFARAMVGSGQSVLQPDAIDPSWLPESTRRRVTHGSALVAAGLTTLLGATIGVASHPRFGAGLLAWLSYFGIPGIGWLSDRFADIDGVVPRGVGALIGGVVGIAVAMSYARGTSVPGPPVRSWRSLGRDLAKSGGGGALLGGPILAVLALVFWLLQQVDGSLGDALINSLLFGIVAGAAVGCSIVFDPSDQPAGQASPSRPQSLRRWVILESLRGLGKGLLLGSLWGLFGWALLRAIFNGAFFEISAGLLMGVVVALSLLAGALGKTLRRGGTLLALARSGNAPSDITRFLDFASECLLLRKGSDGYIFVHRLLMEYFAGLKPLGEDVEAPERVQEPA